MRIFFEPILTTASIDGRDANIHGLAGFWALWAAVQMDQHRFSMDEHGWLRFNRMHRLRGETIEIAALWVLVLTHFLKRADLLQFRCFYIITTPTPPQRFLNQHLVMGGALQQVRPISRGYVDA